MNIHSISFNIQNYIGKNFLNSLTSTQKKTIAIVFAIFSCVALGYYFYRSCQFSARIEKKDEESSTETEKTSNNCFTSQLKDGRTQKVFPNGMIEIGQFENEQLEGEGIRVYPDETRLGIDELEQLEVYPQDYKKILHQIGTFKNGKLHGMGEVKLQDGTLIRGNFEEGQMSKKVQLFVNGLNGKTFSIEISLNQIVEDLKIEIEKKIGLPVDLQRLIWAGKAIYHGNGSTLKFYKIEKEATINLTIPMRGD